MKYSMYCKKCGAQINDHCKICPACGSDTKPPVKNQTETISTTDIRYIGETMHGAKKWRTLSQISAVISVICFLVWAYKTFFGDYGWYYTSDIIENIRAASFLGWSIILIFLSVQLMILYYVAKDKED